MKLFKTLNLAAVAGLMIFAHSAHASDWVIDTSHSEVGFKVRHMMVSNVKGRFKNFSGKISYDEKNPKAATVEAEIDLKSVDTGNERRDKHLIDPDFFDTAKFPKMTFKSTKVKVKNKKKGKLEVWGNLSLHGKTKLVKLEVELTPARKGMGGRVIRGASAETEIKRSDFGLTYNSVLEAGGVAIGDEVDIELEIELQQI